MYQVAPKKNPYALYSKWNQLALKYARLTLQH